LTLYLKNRNFCTPPVFQAPSTSGVVVEQADTRISRGLSSTAIHVVILPVASYVVDWSTRQLLATKNISETYHVTYYHCNLGPIWCNTT